MFANLGPTDVIGFLAAASTIAAFGCRLMLKLRLAAITANVLFISYAALLGLAPILLLHCILLPMNILRLRGLLYKPRQP